jgi:hypothetical protein
MARTSGPLSKAQHIQFRESMRRYCRMLVFIFESEWRAICRSRGCDGTVRPIATGSRVRMIVA